MMKNNVKKSGIAAVLVVAVALVIVVTGAFAQGPSTPAVPGETGQAGQGHGAGAGLGLRAVEEADMHLAIANALGISQEQFEAAIAEGQTPYTLAIELGVDYALVQAAMRDAHAAALDAAVAAGQISQERANWMLNQGARNGTGPTGTAAGTGMMARNGAANLGQAGGFGSSYAGSQGYGGDCPNLNQ